MKGIQGCGEHHRLEQDRGLGWRVAAGQKALSQGWEISGRKTKQGLAETVVFPINEEL